MGRMGQACLRPLPCGIRSRLRIYLDDPMFTLLGDLERRQRELGTVLLLWAACGFKVSWSRGDQGNGINWIGVDYIRDDAAKTVTIQVPLKMIDEIVAIARKLRSKPMGPISQLRKLAGKGSWVFGIAPRSRWAVQRSWATISDAIKRGSTRSKHGGGQRHSLFARRQVELPLRWIVEYWGQSPPPLRRTLHWMTALSALEIVTDASPFGIAGYLEATNHGVILQYFTSELATSARLQGNSNGKHWRCWYL